ncbi:hypothetical protein [Altericista sp. CCNU0014]|uniref:hypothetical protein n=1 Tax=Altericista sp. CCNU0014 TaxID=3082949 RepID=UPI00384B9F1B
MSNKLKVIALLLPVSLLSGYNGATGSGNSKASMQSNGPLTNTTSIPPAEARIPSRSAGNLVRVARWSANGPSMLAVKKGVLAVVNNCLVMSNMGAPPTLLIFPYRTGVWDNAKRSLSYNGKVTRIGEPIGVGGGKIKTLDELKQSGKYEVPDCGITDFFLVNGTIGSGSPESSMQSSSPSTNTPSVPTAKAHNPSRSTGDAVRVARWSRNPNTTSLLAPLKGPLAIANNCLVMNHKGFGPTLLIFPHDSGVWDDAKRTFTYEGKVIGIGKPIEVGGRFIPNLDYLKAYGKYDVPDCGINALFQVF